MSQDAPRSPLEEKDAEIARLQHMIAVKDAALWAVREWLEPVIYPDEKQLDEALKAALDCR